MFDAISKLSMGLFFIAAAPLDASTSDIWLQWGLAGVVIAYTLARDWQREKRMYEELNRHHLWAQSTLMAALDRSSIAIEKITQLERERGPHASRPAANS